MSASLGSVVPVVGFAGPRQAPAAAAGLVSALVRSVLASGRAVAAGCASGVDSLAVAAALQAGAGKSLLNRGLLTVPMVSSSTISGSRMSRPLMSGSPSGTGASHKIRFCANQ